MSLPPDDRTPRSGDPVGYDDLPRDGRAGEAPADSGRAHDRRPADDRPRRDDRRGADQRDADQRDRRPAPELPPEESTGGSRTAGIWIALILGAIVMIMLLIFILQNNTRAEFEYFGATFSLPLGVAMLLAAIAGALVMALVGSVRMIQMALSLRKLRRQVHEIRRTVGSR